MSGLKDFMGIPMLPINAAANGDTIDRMNEYIHWFMLALFVFWSAFFIYTLVRFRASRQPRASYEGLKASFPKYLEAGVVIVEIILLVGFSIPLWAQWTEDFPAEKDAVVVRVVAEQFAWNFHYAGPDGKFGKGNPKLIDVQTNPLGLDRKGDADAADDVVVKQLHLPVDKPAIAHVSSKDVIHAFGIPALRVKQDATPGMSIPVAFTPIREGKYLIACSQLCGVGHSTMRGFVEIHSKASFEQWMSREVEQAKSAGSEESW